MSKELLDRFVSSIILVPLIIFLVVEGDIIFNIFIFICFALTLIEWHNMSKKYNHYIPGIFFLFFSFISIYLLRNKFNGEYLYLLFILFICIATDIGGYVIGKLIKGPKLSKISPNKTYSGMLGSFLFSIIFSYFFLKSPLLEYSKNITLEILAFVIIISAISQVGDLVVSYFKRVSKIKDTGKIIPGHGGILDRIDGILFALPLSLIILLMDIISIF